MINEIVALENRLFIKIAGILFTEIPRKIYKN
jgi:hypothetical protein